MNGNMMQNLQTKEADLENLKKENKHLCDGSGEDVQSESAYKYVKRFLSNIRD